MARIPGLRRLFRFPRRSNRQIDREIDDELAFHIDMVAAELVAEGVPPYEARDRARRQFGNVDRARLALRADERVIERDRRRADLGHELQHDLTFAARQLRRSPTFALVAILTLGLGIGATTAIFSVADGVLLRPLPYPQADRLVRLFQLDAQSTRDDATPANFFDWRERNRSFERLAFFQYFGHDVQGAAGETISINSWLVSEDYFAVLGVAPRLGRIFRPEEFRPGAAAVAIISTSLWQQRFGADPAVLGRKEILDGVAHTIIGVMPVSFQFPERRYIWAPKILSEEDKRDRASTYLGVVGRLRPGVTIQAAGDDMSRIARELAATYPSTNAKIGVELASAPDELLGPVRPALLVLLGAVFCVLLVACANVANLLLARGADRRREFAIRAALGAGCTRLARQMITESAVLAALGCAVGLVLGKWGITLLLALTPATLPRTEEIALDGRVLLFTLGATLATALLFGLAPAFLATRMAPFPLLKGEPGGAARPSGNRVLKTLVVPQVALSLALLTATGLLLRSLQVLYAADVGMRRDEVLTMSAYPSLLGYEHEREMRLYREWLERIGGMPGIRSVALARSSPALFRAVPGRFNIVSPRFFETLGVDVLRGREFTPADSATSAPVAVINDSAARKYFENGDALGRALPDSMNAPAWARAREIVGVVRDSKHNLGQQRAGDELYVPYTQVPAERLGQAVLLVRTVRNPAELAAAVRRETQAIEKDLALLDVRTLKAELERSVGGFRAMARLLGTVGGLALALAAIGLHGTLAYIVRGRTREIGIRIVLGARAPAMLWMVIRETLSVVLAGALLGIGLAFLAGRALASFLFGVEAAHPAIAALVVLLLLAVTVLAAWLPARRAMKVDPLTALRFE